MTDCSKKRFSRVLLVTAQPRSDLPTGIERRLSHWERYCEENEVRYQHLAVRASTKVGRRPLLGNLLWLATSALVLRRQTIVVVGLLSPNLLRLSAQVAYFASDVVFDACDSWALLKKHSEGIDEGVAELSRRGAQLQKTASPSVAVSYVSERDREADSDINRGRETLVVSPTPDKLTLGMPSPPPGPVERFAISGALTSFHLHSGVAKLAYAWERFSQRYPSFALDAYGPDYAANLGGLSQVTHHGFVADLRKLYEGRTVVLILNEGGSGVPNKLLETIAAKRAFVAHESLAELISDQPGMIATYSSGETLLSALEHAVMSDYYR